MFLYVIVKISEFSKNKKILICLVPAIVSVNVIDQILMLTDYHNYYREVSHKISEQDERWNKIFNKHAVLCGSINSDDTSIGKRLVKNNNTLNNFYLARGPYEEIQSYFNQVTNKLIVGDKIDDDIIFIFKENYDISWVNKDIFELDNIDGFIIAYNKNIELFEREETQ